jgi:CSLREA domain-containing protein
VLAHVSCRPRSRGLIATIAVTACVLALPATASAVTYEVDSLGDEADAALGVAGCKTVGLVCSLRAAIEESNNSTSVDDLITFKSTVFKGELANSITLGAGFPAITDKVTIDGDGGGQCATAAGVSGPCVGVSGPAAGGGLVVNNADQVTIKGLAVSGVTSGTAINVINSSEELTVFDTWIGLKLDGTAASNRTGIFLDPGSNRATIGGALAALRNVFANNEFEGLDIQGASEAKVAGNYFGVKPNGTTGAANGKDIEVTSSASTEAAGNEIGATVDAGALATAACDGGCNVIAGNAGSAIDLYGEGGGEEPPAKETKIHGNYIGLNAAGSAALATGLFVVSAGKSIETTIGGAAAGDANHINGGSYGIYGSGGSNVGAPKLVIQGNMFGLNPAGTAALSPSGVGIFNSSENGITLAQTAKILKNRFAGNGGTAIEQHSRGALIKDNVLGRGTGGELLSAGSLGIKLRGSLGGSTVEGNMIAGAEANGVLIENEHNELLGNTIIESGAAGIRIQKFGGVLPSTGNTIGGETAGEENEISNSGGDAIEIVEDENDDEQIKRNFGSENTGLFIDLGKNGPGNEASGPNDGMQAPVVGKATTSGISGNGALPNAEIRVFRKADASEGEVEGFLGKVKADGSGNWELTYGAKIAGKTNVGVNQSALEGTSELAFGVTEPEPEKPGGGEEKGGGNGGGNGGANGGGNGGGGGSTKDTTAPQTMIAKKPKPGGGPKVKFKFSSSESGSSFECKLDGKPFKKCRSPKAYKGLRPGKHVFKVRATDAAGNVDSTPAKKKFRVSS